jgi:integrating conjugative element protein (TIGR03765 family)
MTGRMWPLQGAALLLALVSLIAARAAPIVIYDSGQTQPLAPYYESLRGEATAPETGQEPSGKSGLTAEDLLPIETPEMTPGPVTSRALNRPGALSGSAVGARPLFLIGTDPLSRRWLVQHRKRLKEIGAVGLLVAAETTEDLEAIARIGEGLPIMPASGSEIARLYALEHYPVLIWQGRIEQ